MLAYAQATLQPLASKHSKHPGNRCNKRNLTELGSRAGWPRRSRSPVLTCVVNELCGFLIVRRLRLAGLPSSVPLCSAMPGTDSPSNPSPRALRIRSASRRDSAEAPANNSTLRRGIHPTRIAKPGRPNPWPASEVYIQSCEYRSSRRARSPIPGRRCFAERKVGSPSRTQGGGKRKAKGYR
jgi:hypothetical protein